jgi:hypothetical protein
MTATKLPPDDHVVRYVRKRLLRKDEDGNLLGVLPQAFEHKEKESYLSVTWLEHFVSEYEQALVEATTAIRRQLTVKPKDGFTTGRVGRICDICELHDVRVRVLREPVAENTGHSALRGLRHCSSELLDMLAAEAFTDTRVAAEVAPPA